MNSLVCETKGSSIVGCKAYGILRKFSKANTGLNLDEESRNIDSLLNLHTVDCSIFKPKHDADSSRHAHHRAVSMSRSAPGTSQSVDLDPFARVESTRSPVRSNSRSIYKTPAFSLPTQPKPTRAVVYHSSMYHDFMRMPPGSTV